MPSSSLLSQCHEWNDSLTKRYFVISESLKSILLNIAKPGEPLISIIDRFCYIITQANDGLPLNLPDLNVPQQVIFSKNDLVEKYIKQSPRNWTCSASCDTYSLAVPKILSHRISFTKLLGDPTETECVGKCLHLLYLRLKLALETWKVEDYATKYNMSQHKASMLIILDTFNFLKNSKVPYAKFDEVGENPLTIQVFLL